jgi:hypothetical protein
VDAGRASSFAECDITLRMYDSRSCRRSSSARAIALYAAGSSARSDRSSSSHLNCHTAQPVGERREQLEDFLRRRPAQRLVRGDHVAQRLHALGELDQDDPDVLDHRQQHLAQALGLRRAFRRVEHRCVVVDLAHPHDAFDQHRDVRSEFLAQLPGGIRGPLGLAEQQRRGHRFVVELQRRQDSATPNT